MCQAVTLSQDIIDFVQSPLAPPRRQAGAHGGHAGGFAGFERRIAPGIEPDKAAGLMRDGVEGAEQAVEALAEMGGVEGLVFGSEG